MINKKTVTSPCIAVCELNRNNICTGCFRSSDEIAAWSQLSHEAKKKVLQNAYHRELHSKPLS